MINFNTSQDERVSMISQLIEEAERNQAVREYYFRKEALMLPIIEIEPTYLVYRLENTRTKTIQKSKVHREGLSIDYFDPIKYTNDVEVQNAQHEILLSQIQSSKGSRLGEEFERKGRQTEPILITTTGKVINGNRRLTYMRQQGTGKYPLIKCLVLNQKKFQDPKWERAFENDADFNRNVKLDYVWHAEAYDVWSLRNEEKLPDDEIFIHKPGLEDNKKNLEQQILCAELALKSLEIRNIPEQWEVLDESSYHFKSAAEKIYNLQTKGGIDKEEEIQAIKTTLFLMDAASRDAFPSSIEKSFTPFRNNPKTAVKVLKRAQFVPPPSREKNPLNPNEEITTSKISIDHFPEVFTDQNKIDDAVDEMLKIKKDIEDDKNEELQKAAWIKKIRNISSELHQANTMLDEGIRYDTEGYKSILESMNISIDDISKKLQ